MTTALPSAWPERMSPTDALFWSTNRIPTARSTIGAILVLAQSPSRAALRAEFLRLAHALPRMRQRVLEVPLNLAPPEWADDPDFDLDQHLRWLAVPPPGGMAELLAELGPLYTSPLERERPLWEAVVVEGLAGDRGAVFLRMHHCLTDGAGGARLLESLLDRGTPRDPGPKTDEPAHAPTDALHVLWRAQLHHLTGGVDIAQSFARAASDPLTTLTDVWRGMRTAAGFGRELLTARAPSPLDRQRSPARQLATFEMSLAHLDDARARLGATHNDVVLTIVSGAMHRWHRSRSADVHELRALVPVDLRRAGDDVGGNRIALLAVGLPVGEPDPLRRLRTIQERMRQVKADRRALTALPSTFAARIGREQARRANFACANVPGPQRACFLAGEPIEKVFAFVPLVGDHPVAITLFSYRNTVFVGVDIDPLAMDDLPCFLDAMRATLEEVLRIARPPPS